MTDPFLAGTYVTSILLFASFLAVEAWFEQRKPPSRDDWMALLGLAKQDLAGDVDAVREYSARDIARIALETPVVLGLVFRSGVHHLAYFAAVPHKRPEWSTIGFGDPVGPRPDWHRVSSVVASAALIGFFAQNYPVGAIDTGLSPLARYAVLGWMCANAIAAVCDPLVHLIRITHKQLTATITKTYT
jgi:hypothetical protein